MTPDAPIVAQAWSVRLWRALALGVGFVLTINIAYSQDGRTSFDIPAQALATALEAFSAASGYQILMADTSAGTARSSAVSGMLLPRDALVQLVAGIGLEVHFTGAQAAVLARAARSQVTSIPTLRRLDQEHYEAALQNEVIFTLCRSAVTRPGQYRTAIDLWVASSGRIDNVELLSSTGDTVRDRQIVAVLLALAPPPPPPGLRQPTTLLLLPGGVVDAARICDHGARAPQRAATP